MADNRGLIITIVLLIIVLSVVDLFANFLSLVPIVGDIAETLSETLIETIQVLLASSLGVIASRRR